MLPQLRVRCLIGCLSAWCALSAHAADPIKVESSIELPKYTVIDTRPLPKPERWLYAEFPGFEVLSNASDRNTRQILEDFRLFEQALEIVWPTLKGKSQVPATLVLCGKNHFDSFVPDAAKLTDGSQGTASLFFDNGPRSAIVVDVGVSVLNLNTTDSAALNSAGVTTAGIEVEEGEQLKREYIRLLLSRLQPRWPAWFEEGLAQLLRGMEVTEKRITFAKLEDPNEISITQAQAIESARQNADAGIDLSSSAPAEDRGFQSALARSALMGFPEMFAVKRESRLAQNPIGSSWAKQCYAFVHMCLYGEGQRYQKGFLKFITRLTKEEPSEALFKECFETGYRSMGTTLRSYVTGAAYKSMEWNAGKGSKGFADFSKIVPREATQGEVGRIKGETYTLGGHRDEAQRELITAYRRGERDPRLLAALGLFEQSGGDTVKARKFLEAAAEQKVVRAEAYLALAKLRIAEASANAGEEKPFTVAEVDAITALLRTAAQQPPAMPEVYETLADTWARSPEKLKREQVVVLVRASVQNPARLRLIYQTAQFCADAGMLQEAHALTDHGLVYAPTESVKQRFSELKAKLPPAPPAAKSSS
ncbi:tetratricopeptide repeat protein [Oleiharenicola lentus]|uniref:tetratricopeptide repeat protein n=1 Tax=Oleiharenicola lentus TaxID=2508720 RepID=UPI003F67EF6B